MDKKFFDNTIIAQYAVTGVPLKVYVDSRYLTITDADDVENPLIGQGMEPNGEMEPFSYQDIDHLLVADNIIDLETYNTAMADQFKSDEPEEAPEGDEEAPEEEGEEGEEGGDDMPDEEVPEEEPEEEEPTTEEGFDPTGISLSEITKDVKKAREKALDAEEKALKDKRRALDDEPLDELTLGGPSGEAMLQDLHLETDPAKQKKMKIKLGREKYGAYSDRSALEDADYALKKFRQQMRGYTGDPIGVYDPAKDTYKAKAKAPKVRWTQKKYDRWIDDVSSNEGWRNAYDMAQNANNEPGLIDWVKKNVVFNDETPLERIQYDIEAMAESVNEARYSLEQYKALVKKSLKNPKVIDDQHFYDEMLSAFQKGTPPAKFVAANESVNEATVKSEIRWTTSNVPDVEKAALFSAPYPKGDGDAIAPIEKVKKRWETILSKKLGGPVDLSRVKEIMGKYGLRIVFEYDGRVYRLKSTQEGPRSAKYALQLLKQGSKVESVNEATDPYKSIIDKWTPPNLLDFAKELRSMDDATRKGFEEHVAEMADVTRDSEWMGMIKAIEAIKRKYNMKESKKIREAKGRPYGLSKEETLEVAKRFAKALSITDGVKVTVNMTTLDEDSFDLDYDGIEFDGGSYNIYDDGAVKNMATMKTPTIGYKDDSVQSIVKYLKKHYGKLAKNEASDLPKGPSKAGVKRLIKDVEEMLDTEIDANGDPLTNETEMILQKELKRLKAFLRESVNEGIDGLKAGDRVQNQYDSVIATIKSIDGNSVTVVYDDMKSLRNEFGPEAKEFYNQSEKLPMAKFKKAWDRKEYTAVNEAANKLDKELLKHIDGMRISKSDKDRVKGYLQKADIDPRADIKDLITHTKEILDIKEKEDISYGSIKKLGPWANLDEAPNTAYRVVGDSPTSKESNHPETVYANSEKEAIEKYRRTVKPTPINVQIVKEANSYDSWKERGNQLEKQAMADAINAFGKAAKRKDFEEMVDMFVSDREINGGEYLDAFRIVLKKYNLEDEFRKQLADLDITKTPYEMNEDVSSPYIYQVGDLVQNINPTCPHHGSKGIVMSVEPEELTYSVTNSGDTFKPGMRLTKTLDQLETM